jgi:hypothetical protein
MCELVCWRQWIAALCGLTVDDSASRATFNG